MSDYVLVRKKWLRGLQKEAERMEKNVEESECFSELDKAHFLLLSASLRGHVASARSIHEWQPKSLTPIKRELVWNHETMQFEYQIPEAALKPIPWV